MSRKLSDTQFDRVHYSDGKTIFLEHDINDLVWHIQHGNIDADAVLVELNVTLTPDEMAGDLDDECENDNYHDLVGAHAGLLELLRKYIQEESKVRDLMVELYDKGGIRGLC
jgi:hypothetical protein